MMPTLPSSLTYCRSCSFARACTGSIGNASAHRLDVGVAEQRVVVDRHLRVEGDDPAVLEQHERVHLDERRVAFAATARTCGARRRRRPHAPRRGGSRPARGRGRPAAPASGRRAPGAAPRAACERAPRCPCRPRRSSSRGSRPWNGRAGSTCRTPGRSAAAPRTSTWLTACPLKSEPSMRAASSAARSGESTSTTPPPLPRPPTCTCTLTTLLPAQRAVVASAGLAPASRPRCRVASAMPWARNSVLALVLVEVHRTPIAWGRSLTD